MKNIFVGLLLAVAFLVFSVLAAHSQPYAFTTALGSASNPGNADGTNAAAQFISPTGLALGNQGDLFVVDGNAIRKITTSGTNRSVRTLTGLIGLHSFADGTNSAARFNYPQGVAVDAAGNLYVADTYNNAIRKITPVGTNWVVTTIAGSAPPASLFGSVDGTNNNARFHNPYGIAVDSATNLYVTDSLNHTIRKISPVGANWVVTTLAGLANVSGSANGSNSTARFNGPVSVAVDSAGVIYVADFLNHTIRKLIASGTNWSVTTLAGSPGVPGTSDGVGSAAGFNLPQDIAIDAGQNLFVTDSGNNTIRKISPAGKVSTLAGSPGIPGSADGTGSTALFNQPYGVAVDASGILYVADYLNYSIRAGQVAPLMQLSASGQQLILSWPAGLTGVVPEFCNSLSAGCWSPMPTNGAVRVEDYFFLTNSRSSGSQFFRLHKQTP